MRSLLSLLRIGVYTGLGSWPRGMGHEEYLKNKHFYFFFFKKNEKSTDYIKQILKKQKI